MIVRGDTERREAARHRFELSTATPILIAAAPQRLDHG